MNEFFTVISQLGVAPAVAGYLLWDYSKKLSLMQIELTKINERLDNIQDLLKRKK